jgi:hypothetical protein
VPTPTKEISVMSVASQDHADKSSEQLANRRAAETFDLEADGLRKPARTAELRTALALLEQARTIAGAEPADPEPGEPLA